MIGQAEARVPGTIAEVMQELGGGGDERLLREAQALLREGHAQTLHELQHAKEKSRIRINNWWLFAVAVALKVALIAELIGFRVENWSLFVASLMLALWLWFYHVTMD
jgi:Mg2+/citrate symporter